MTVIPLGTPPAWAAVMTAAGHQCQCTHACGKSHPGGHDRCRETTDQGLLIAAPADLTLPTVAAAAVPTALLLAWCDGCHRRATTRQRADARKQARLEAVEPAGLFDL